MFDGKISHQRSNTTTFWCIKTASLFPQLFNEETISTFSGPQSRRHLLVTSECLLILIFIYAFTWTECMSHLNAKNGRMTRWHLFHKDTATLFSSRHHILDYDLKPTQNRTSSMQHCPRRSTLNLSSPPWDKQNNYKYDLSSSYGRLIYYRNIIQKQTMLPWKSVLSYLSVC